MGFSGRLNSRHRLILHSLFRLPIELKFGVLQGQADDGHDVSIWVLTKRIRGAHYLVALAFLVSLAAFPGFSLCIRASLSTKTQTLIRSLTPLCTCMTSKRMQDLRHCLSRVSVPHIIQITHHSYLSHCSRAHLLIGFTQFRHLRWTTSVACPLEASSVSFHGIW